MWTVVKILMFVVFTLLPEVTQNLLQKVSKFDSKLRQTPFKNLFRMQCAFLIDLGTILAPKMDAKSIQNGTRIPKKSSRGPLRVAQAAKPLPHAPPSPSGHHLVHFLATLPPCLIKFNKSLTKIHKFYVSRRLTAVQEAENMNMHETSPAREHESPGIYCDMYPVCIPLSLIPEQGGV